MFKNYFKIAWRNLMKNKVFSGINILGLTIGITCCLMIFIFIINENSFDSFHKAGKNIYRVMRGVDIAQGQRRVPYLSGPYAPALLNEYPNEIKKAVRVRPDNALVTYGDKSFNEQKYFVADPDFFTLFTFPLLKGDPATALKDANSIVITESIAKKYFGKEDPMGKTLMIDKLSPMKVTGVAKDIPANSHLDFDMIQSMVSFYNQQWFKEWINHSMFVYVLLDEHVDRARLEKQFPHFMQKYVGKEMAAKGFHFDLALTALADIYFEPNSTFDNVRHGDKKVVYIFLSVAILILVIACINFTNLSTVRAIERSKEVGLRKVMGALRGHLVWQFIGESLLLTIISCILALGLLEILLPSYNRLLGHAINVSWNSFPIYAFLFGVILCAGFLAGCYPALFLSAFSPIQALKGKLRLGKGGTFLRQSLVTLQFSIGVLLIVGTIVIISQMNYMKTRDLGYDKEQTILVPIDNVDIYDHRNSFKNELVQNSRVTAVSAMSGEPGGFFDGQTFAVEGQKELWKGRTEFTDADYVKTMGLKIIAGRNLSAQYSTDSAGAVLINRTAAGLLGYTPGQALGKWIQNMIRDSIRRRIVGVVEDFNFLSLKEKMDALVISPGSDHRVLAIKTRPGDIPATVALIGSAYKKAAPGYPFEYRFLDQQFDWLYRTEMRQQSVLTIFAGLAIFIACLGLFGLASFAAAKRTKEIGVRKVLGSSVGNIVLLLSRDLIRPVLLASLIAMPLGYMAMNSWLRNFAYHIPVYWWTFLLAGGIIGSIALLTISYQAIKAAIANPVTSLRSE